ncbi:MAG: hypothetical protein ACYSSI_00455 [Planctomycetota bacterium]|jgi:hypothetical protein
MAGSIANQLYACGHKGLPREIIYNSNRYKLDKVLKHDFFAATSIYKLRKQANCNKTSVVSKIVLKLGREQYLLGFPMRWLGEFLCNHEIKILGHLKDLKQIPKFLGRYGKTGFIYEYIDGRPLSKTKTIPNDFFDESLELLQQIHQRDIVYLDMNERSNILLGTDKKPYLVDFHISLYLGEQLMMPGQLREFLRTELQKSDIYHLLKHKRRLQPRLLRPNEETMSYCIGKFVKIHRMMVTPLRRLRRKILKYFRIRAT